jgi:hypothetical protein
MSNRQNSQERDPPKEESDSNNGDARPKGYYYDDSTGYETYDAENDIDEEDASEGKSQGAES